MNIVESTIIPDAPKRPRGRPSSGISRQEQWRLHKAKAKAARDKKLAAGAAHLARAVLFPAAALDYVQRAAKAMDIDLDLEVRKLSSGGRHRK